MAAKAHISLIARNTKLIGQVESKDTMIIAGEVEGDIESRKVIIKDTGAVRGNITCGSLIIEPGGIFDGRAFMTETETDERPPKKSD